MPKSLAVRLNDPLPALSVQALHHSGTVAVYDVRCRPTNFRRGAEEWSRSDQVVFPRRGVFERELRGERRMADCNQVLFFNRDEIYHITHPGGCGDDCTVFAFDDALLRSAIAERDPASAEAVRVFRFAQAPSGQRLFALQHLLRRVLLEERDDSLGIDDVAVELLQALLESAYAERHPAPRGARPETSRVHREYLVRTRLLLATRFSEPLSLAALAGAVECSPFHLARLFQREVGLSIHQYRHRLRLREALRRLAEGAEDLSALALELGFSSHSHFTDAFRAAFGLPPSRCRSRLPPRQLRELSKNLEADAAPRA